MADAKPRKWRRGALGTGGLVLVWLFGVWPPPVWWRDHAPRCTAMMRHRVPACPALQWSKLGVVAPVLPRMVIIGEDSRFRTHHGVDFIEIGDAVGVGSGRGAWTTLRDAWRHRDRLRGASTITQQLAKNLYLSSSRNPLRKVKEAVTALRLESALSKDRILELYLNVVEWGPGVWGADAASRAYFGVPASRVDESQAAALAATLPHPRTSNPMFRPDRMTARRDLILARYRGVEVDIPPAEETDTLQVPAIAPTPVESLPIEAPIPVDTTQDSVTAGRSASVSPPTAAASPAPYSWRGHPSRPAPPSRRARAP